MWESGRVRHVLLYSSTRRHAGHCGLWRGRGADSGCRGGDDPCSRPFGGAVYRDPKTYSSRGPGQPDAYPDSEARAYRYPVANGDSRA